MQQSSPVFSDAIRALIQASKHLVWWRRDPQLALGMVETLHDLGGDRGRDRGQAFSLGIDSLSDSS